MLSLSSSSSSSAVQDVQVLQKLQALQKLQDFLRENQSVKFIRFQWVDYSGILRARFVPISRGLQIASGSSAMCLAQGGMFIPISTAPTIYALRNCHDTWNMIPHWPSLRVCGSNANHATVMSFVDQKQALHRFDKCPRTMLTRAVQRLKKVWDAQVLIGFKIEMVLLDDRNNVIEPTDRLIGCSTIAGLRAETLDLVEEIVNALKQASIGVHQFNAGLRDQLKIALAAGPALQAVDSLVLAQEIIRTICLRRKLKATMTPKPTFTGPTNGLHLHLSLNKVGSASPDYFLAGILSHMGSLCAFGIANYDSYARVGRGAAGEWIGFGTNNRDLPVRKVAESHWEFRMMDSTANPYIFTAAVLFAAMDGLANRIELTWQDCQEIPHLLDENLRTWLGLNKRMPATLEEALECLKTDPTVEDWAGQDLLSWYIYFKLIEVEEFGKMPEQEKRFRFLEYF